MLAISDKKYAVVGGGILGILIALRLSQQGARVTLFEAENTLGGLTGTCRISDIVWDKYYHVILLSDMHLRKLLKELNLEQEIQWVETKTGFFTDGKLYSMSNTLEFLMFPALNIIDKLRLGFTIFYASKIRNLQRLEKITVTEWLRKLSGANTFSKLWLPLLRAKLGDYYQKTSAAFIWATIQRMYAARRSGLKKEMFGYVPGGYYRILESLQKRLRMQNVEIKTGQAVTRVKTAEDGSIKIDTGDGASELFHRAILTIPACKAAEICHGITDAEKARLKKVQYIGVVCAALLLKRKITDFYVTNIIDSWAPFTGIIEMSALVDKKYFNGYSMVYLPKYVAPDDPLFAVSDDELREIFYGSLKRMYPGLLDNDLVSFTAARDRYVFALPTLDYSSCLPAIDTSIHGLYILNSAHITNGTLNVNETIQIAERECERFLAA
jgi:protoporphyrinogen oxidase